jgi:hypothetical protein
VPRRPAEGSSLMSGSRVNVIAIIVRRSGATGPKPC